jgi:hypothetical protein
MKDLGTLPQGRFSALFGINNRDELVGFSGTGETDSEEFAVAHAVIWRAGR